MKQYSEGINTTLTDTKVSLFAQICVSVLKRSSVLDPQLFLPTRSKHQEEI